jgi:small subunit ribosomal protein S20e
VYRRIASYGNYNPTDNFPSRDRILLPPNNSSNMSTYDAKKVQQGEQAKIHKIRITLTSRKVSSLEKVCQELIDRSKSKDLRVKGPVRMPTKNLKISTRKTPCGEGSKTWDMYEMR